MKRTLSIRGGCFRIAMARKKGHSVNGSQVTTHSKTQIKNMSRPVVLLGRAGIHATKAIKPQ